MDCSRAKFTFYFYTYYVFEQRKISLLWRHDTLTVRGEVQVYLHAKVIPALHGGYGEPETAGSLTGRMLPWHRLNGGSVGTGFVAKTIFGPHRKSNPISPVSHAVQWSLH